MLRIYFTAIGVLFLVMAYGQSEVSRFAFYNVENLFDTINTPGKRDAEFTPDGDRHWNGYKYHQKLSKLYKVLMAVKGWENLTFIGLCEVENKTVVSNLLYKTPLFQYGYQILHKDSPDERGVDVALLYRTEEFELNTHEFISVRFPFDTTDKTRDILYASGTLLDSDTLHIYLNHWPSRYGGYMKTKPKREYAARVLAGHIDSVARRHPGAMFIVAGDFNDDPTDSGITTLMKNTSETNLAGLLSSEDDGGTTKYRSQWYLFDQLFVSENLIDKQPAPFKVKEATIADFPFLLQEDDRYGGNKLFRTFSGPRYIGGYSDHLPVFMDIIKEKAPANE